MATLQTHRAHCGACAGLMVLVHKAGANLWYYRCQTCGLTTTPRPTAAATEDDVVWGPVTPLTGKNTR